MEKRTNHSVDLLSTKGKPPTSRRFSAVNQKNLMDPPEVMEKPLIGLHGLSFINKSHSALSTLSTIDDFTT